MTTLAITYDEIRRHVGRFIGASRTVSALEADATWNTDVEDALVGGLREFYRPRKVAEGQPHHVWSFLIRDFSITTTASTRNYSLPEDFSGLSGSLSFSAGAEKVAPSIINESDIRQLYANAAASGAPKYAAIRARTTNDRTLYEALLYPTPDAAYTLEGRYPIEPPILSDDNIYPLGGAQHAETILESCLAAAEKIMFPEDGERFHSQRFAQLLVASLEADMALGAAVESPWPLDTLDESLGLTKRILSRKIGEFLKYGAHDGTWTAAQQAKVADVLRDGLRKFYDPVALPGQNLPHDWSFLAPVGQLQLQSGVYEYDLPADFAMLAGSLTYAPGTNVLYPPIAIRSEFDVRHELQYTDAASRPFMAAVRVKPSDGGTGTRYQLIVYPSPDGNYDVSFRYKINPLELESDVALPLGGQAHAQTLIEACLAAAELSVGGAPGPHEAEFTRRLVASVGHDLKVTCPDTFGYLGDGRGECLDLHGNDYHVVTYNGAVVE